MTSSSEGEILQNGQVIRDRWKIKQKIGGGGFGEIYEAADTQQPSHNERVAVKVESSKATKQVLKMEVAVLRRLQGKKHACKFYGCGRNDKFNYLVMSMQGKNLADLRRESPRQCFSVSTSIRLAAQILEGIREIHSIGFLHRDIKPSNFAMGRTNSTLRNVYMLDFGLARLYLNAKGEIRSPRSAAGFRGTVRYAAVSAHKNKEMGRQDDLWSLFYMMAEFIQGALPWRRIKDKDEVGRMKEEVNFEQLLDGCPPELMEFPTHLSTLCYPDAPDYDRLEKCLWSCMNRLGIEMDDPYDWEMAYENLSPAGGNRSKATNSSKNDQANGIVATNVSTRMRSHTTAMRDKVPDNERNRAMETQAPITMGEDEDEQTANGKHHGSHSSQHDDLSLQQRQDSKPKYKRQEFMRPKYGPVSFDVIDAVNARLAAASSNNLNNSQLANHSDLFSKIKVETSIENDPKCSTSPGRPTQAKISSAGLVRASAPPEGDHMQKNAVGTAAHPSKTGSMTALATNVSNTAQLDAATGNVSTLPRQQKPTAESALKQEGGKEQKHSRSITLSIGKRYQNGSKRHNPPTSTNPTAHPIAHATIAHSSNPNVNQMNHFPTQSNETNSTQKDPHRPIGRQSSLGTPKWNESFDSMSNDDYNKSPPVPFEKSFEFDYANRRSPLPPIRYVSGIHNKSPNPYSPTDSPMNTLKRQQVNSSIGANANNSQENAHNAPNQNKPDTGYLTPRSARRMPGSKSATPLLTLNPRPYALDEYRQTQHQLFKYNSEEKAESPRVARKDKALQTNQPTGNHKRDASATAQITSPHSGKEESSRHGNGGLNIMSHFKSLVNSFNNSLSSTSAAAAKLSRRRSLSRGVSLDETRHRSVTTAQLSSNSGILQSATSGGGNSAGHTTPHTVSSATTPTSGLGTTPSSGGGTSGKAKAGDRKHKEDDLEYDEEREMRRQARRQRRKTSDCTQPTKQDVPSSPSRTAQDKRKISGSGTVVHRTMILSNGSSTHHRKEPSNNSDIGNGGFRLLNNGLDVSAGLSPYEYGQSDKYQEMAQPFDDRKSSLACRRKRYQFLNFAPRALSKS
ncbi:protein kinase domain-containing protein [Ditylenchus destructor]|uniref:Protein kinase domain-containing protein n=1 Tax=Ditylenchus destructor TaxID=166010 RepID=A0AAD4MMX8_9BILA|nr:protein kinase domain-containing protein [Ditylenchus destructor]